MRDEYIGYINNFIDSSLFRSSVKQRHSIKNVTQIKISENIPPFTLIE